MPDFSPERASYLRGFLPGDPGYREAKAKALQIWPSDVSCACRDCDETPLTNMAGDTLPHGMCGECRNADCESENMPCQAIDA